MPTKRPLTLRSEVIWSGRIEGITDYDENYLYEINNQDNDNNNNDDDDDDGCPINFDWIFILVNNNSFFFRGSTTSSRCYRYKKKIMRLALFLSLLFCVVVSTSIAQFVTSSSTIMNYDWMMSEQQQQQQESIVTATTTATNDDNDGEIWKSNEPKKTIRSFQLLSGGNTHSSSSSTRTSLSYYTPDEINALHPTPSLQNTILLPKTIEDNLANVNEPLLPEATPYFFHIPRSAGSTIKDILGSCSHIVTASDVGARNGRGSDPNLITVVHGEDNGGSRFVNVDTSTPEGIHMAKKMGLVESGLAGLITTQYFHAGAGLFDKERRGRMFTMIRHPIERAVSLFHYLAIAHWEPTYDPDLAYISIEMYARSKRIEHNWMVRFLTNELERDLTARHLELAKEILRKKCIIGLLDEKNESWLRLQRFFGWNFPHDDDRDCKDRLLNWGWSNKHLHPTIEEGTLAWDLLYKQNELDMMLYEYARLLFEEQTALFGEGGSLVSTNN